MGVDIGVCKYIEDRESKILRLEILETLPGEEGKRYKEELYSLYDNEIHPECNKLKELYPEKLELIGHRMRNLYYEIALEDITIRFSFYDRFSEKRVTPKMLIPILNDMFKLRVIASDDEKDVMDFVLDFLSFVCENNLVIYPA